MILFYMFTKFKVYKIYNLASHQDSATKNGITCSSSIRSTSQTISWLRTATLSLLQQVKKRYSTLKDKITKNKVVWKAVSESLQNLQPGITPGQCDQKWRNLQQQYKKYIDNSTKTGRGRVSKPEFLTRLRRSMVAVTQSIHSTSLTLNNQQHHQYWTHQQLIGYKKKGDTDLLKYLKRK